MSRWAWADVDPAAVRHNVAMLCELVAPAEVWSVVKAGGYGHGAVTTARAALDGGATALCVALVQEGLEIRAAGIHSPILVLTEQPAAQLPAAVAADLDLMVATTQGIDAIAAVGPGHRVHLEIDTGMRRTGCPPEQATDLAAHVLAVGLRLAGTATHFAVADQPDHPFTTQQLARFDSALDQLRARGIDPGVVHAANSAGALAHPTSRRNAVRIGIAQYGLAPGPGVAHLCTGLRPALALRSRVSFLKRVRAGDGISYGLRHHMAVDTNVATVPIGYADGVPRRLFECGGEVLVRGRRRRIVGVVTMDQLMIDVGDDAVEVGDEVVLIGEQDGQRITADEWALLLGTIGYEVVCALSSRIERRVAP